MVSYRIYQYTSIARPPDPSEPAMRVIGYLLPVVAVLGAVLAWQDGQDLAGVLREAVLFALALYGSWALARELDPDDTPTAFLGAGAALLAMLLADAPGILIVYVTLGLVRTVNRSSGLPARHTDAILLAALAIWLMYAMDSPLYGLVAGLAFALDGSLREPLRRQWLFALICLGAIVVYTVDHGFGLAQIGVPDSLFEWLGLLFVVIFALDAALLKRVRACADVKSRPLDVNRVRGGMTVGFLAALQGLTEPDHVVLIIAVLAGLCVGIALRKGFRAPVA
ncbi:MAG: hypothetical protein P8Y52_11915 [Xanthomonadales bacterium]